jgi:hypothetical protein
MRAKTLLTQAWLTLAIALSGSLAVTGAEAAAAKRVRHDPLIVRGCTQYVPPICAGIVTGGRTYSLFSAIPSLPLGVGVDVYGKVEGISPCLASVHVNVTSWRKNRMHC